MAERVPKRIKHIVYLDGYIPEYNKSAFDVVNYLQRRALKERGREWLVASHEPEIGSHTIAITKGNPSIYTNNRITNNP